LVFEASLDLVFSGLFFFTGLMGFFGIWGAPGGGIGLEA
jgi:hypothetical protein